MSLAGVVRRHALARGEHPVVDGLVTPWQEQGKRCGGEVIGRLSLPARGEGLARIDLDRRAAAKGLPERGGFPFSTSIPCRLQVAPDSD